MNEMKKCFKCGDSKPLDMFYYVKVHNRHHSYCKECMKGVNKKAYSHEKWKKYYAKNQDKILDYQRNYYAENTADVNERCRQYYAENREAVKALNTEWADRNPLAVKAHRLSFYARRNGTLVMPDKCECCSAESDRLEFHHHPEHYDTPLDGLFICKTCHRRYHKGSDGLVEEIDKIFNEKYGY